MPAAKIERPKTTEDWFCLGIEISNLFSSAPIDEERLFAGRAKQVRQLLEAVLEKSKHAVLFGERGVGKTSLTNKTAKALGLEIPPTVLARADEVIE